MHEETALLESPVLSAVGYLDAEAHSKSKHEYHNGKLIEMAGADYYHNKIKLELALLIERFLRASNLPFETLDSDMKTWFPAKNKFVYPDLTVLQKPPQFFVTENGHVRRDALVNPMLIVEVLSPETAGYDKGEKFELYCSLDSFREYVLVEPETPWVKTIFIEDAANGIHRVKTVTDPNESFYLHTIGCSIVLGDLYKALEGITR
jgi:Uma2 family endonuclease